MALGGPIKKCCLVGSCWAFTGNTAAIPRTSCMNAMDDGNEINLSATDVVDGAVVSGCLCALFDRLVLSYIV